VISGNNAKKTEYIKQSVDAGIHVLADKPMAINTADFDLLLEAFEVAKANNVLLYDIMTERHEITTILQKELSQVRSVFGQLIKGSSEEPAITKESVHHFFKYVSGNPIKRPAWFFDVSQQGEGIVDVTTHLVDLVQWECFPNKILNYKQDIDVYEAKRWPTRITPAQFQRVTGLEGYPDYLSKDVIEDSILNVFANGEIRYTLNGIHARVSVVWNYEAPEGAKDTHYSIMRGTISNLVIRQGEEQDYKPVLYVEKLLDEDVDEFEEELSSAIHRLSEKYPGIGIQKVKSGWEVLIPDEFKVGHEAHFTQVTQKFLQYLEEGKLPDWEVPNMIAKYYTTTIAFELSR
jgi:predicted dehydrogenase